jgi:hypothetical protein
MNTRCVTRLLVVSAMLGLGIASAGAQQATEPGGNPNDTALAIQNPDEYAWRLFLFLNRQALLGKAGVVDPTKDDIKSYDPDRDVVWETWAVATGGIPAFRSPGEVNSSEVYKDRGEKPVAWEELPRTTGATKTLEANLTSLTRTVRSTLTARDLNPANPNLFIAPGVVFPPEFEVRMNKSTFDTIRLHGMYSVEGLESLFRDAQRTGNREAIKFDPASKEVKAKWIKITEADKPRYHWRTIQRRDAAGNTTTETWGLAGLHILTKDLPNWFWADFEHVDWESKQPNGAPDPRKSVDSTTRDNPARGTTATAGREGIRNETVGSKWQNYRLRGTQIDFVDKSGAPIEVANTLIEPLSNGPSSCMTCHAKASIGLRSDPTQRASPPFVANNVGPDFTLGIPDPTAFLNAGQMAFLQTDFIWSPAFRAHSTNE